MSLSAHPGARARAPLAALCAVLAALAALVLAPNAHAAPATTAGLADMACPAGNQTVSFSPGLHTAPATTTITYDARLGVCASLSHPEITSGYSAGTVVAAYSCADLLNTSTGTQDFHWSNGQSSTLSFTRTVTILNGQTVITLTGPITSGLFTGDTAVFTVVEPLLDVLACQSTAGLTSQAGITTLLIT
jgi:hypothetical protein